jgi:hypothetical protein
MAASLMWGPPATLSLGQSGPLVLAMELLF